ncbi:hypothetical protein ACFX13_043297 [Malus domestica]
MGKPVNPWMGMQKKKCTNSGIRFGDGSDSTPDVVHSAAGRAAGSGGPNPLDIMKSKLVLFVSHELPLSGNRIPLLLMELAFLLRRVGAENFLDNEPETGGR